MRKTSTVRTKAKAFRQYVSRTLLSLTGFYCSKPKVNAGQGKSCKTKASKVGCWELMKQTGTFNM